MNDEQVVAVMAALLVAEDWGHTPQWHASQAQDLFDAVRAERARRAKERGE